MTTKLNKSETLSRYSAIMNEIRRRIDGVEHCLNHETGLHRLLEFELCFLQLRKVCELIALGCLIAHGDIPEVHGKTMSKQWKEGEIL